jgi:flagellin
MASYDVTRIAGNIGALNSLNALENVNKQLASHQARLASGKRINSAADDPAGLSIATKLNTRSEGLKTALSNIGDAQNLLSVAESGMSKINDILTEMRNKAQQGASDTMGTDERQALVDQMSAYSQQIQDSVDQTQWNGNKLLDGLKSFTNNTLTFQTGANSADATTLSGMQDMGVVGLGLGTLGNGTIASAAGGVNQQAAVGFAVDMTKQAADKLAAGTINIDLTTTALGVTTVALTDGSGNTLKKSDGTAITGTWTAGTKTVTVGSGIMSFTVGSVPANSDDSKYTVAFDPTAANLQYSSGNNLTASSATAAADFGKFMDVLAGAQKTVSNQLAKLGSLEGRLNFKQDQVTNDQANVESAYNRIMNADMANEQVQASKLSILQQTSTAMLAQANAAPQFILSLFK